jgi:integrase
MNNPRREIRSLQERIRTSNKIGEADRELLLLFNRRLHAMDSRFGEFRIRDLLRRCTIIAEETDKLEDALESREAAEDIVLWIKDRSKNENTRHGYRNALRVFGELVTDADEKPDSISWIPSGVSSSHNPVPNPGEMLTWDEDILPMIGHCRNSRDKAAIAVAFDSGARPGELFELTLGDVNDHRHGLEIFVDGKRGQRSVTLIPSVPYLQRWLSDHPGKNDSKCALWTRLNEAEPIEYEQFAKCFTLPGKRAGIQKPTNPENFRKSNATWLARQGMNEPFINDRQGRDRRSTATAHYVAEFGSDGDDQYARLHGVEVEEEEPEPFGPIDCPRCDRETPRHEDSCMWCGQSLNFEAIENAPQRERELREAVFRIARDDPQILNDVEVARDLAAIFEDNPRLYEDAKGFVEALSEN